MDIEMAQKYNQIQIQDDLKYDIRIENAELERYFTFLSVLKNEGAFSEVCIVAISTEKIIETTS